MTLHYEDLADDQIGWWEQIPTVTAMTAIDQCIRVRVRPDLVYQAIDMARCRGLIDEPTAGRQRHELTAVAHELEDAVAEIALWVGDIDRLN